MRIHSLSYKDTIQGWEVSEINFHNLTLLVGVSGVGKTQILEAILNITRIADGVSLNGVQWKISFSHDGKNYNWTGEFGTKEKLEKNDWLFVRKESTYPKLIKETIYLNDKQLAKKENGEIIFQGVKMPRLASSESLMSIFREEEDIQSGYQGFQQIVFRDHTEKAGTDIRVIENYKEFTAKYTTLDDIRTSNLFLTDKLLLLYENQKSYFNEIVYNYRDIFPQVEDIKIDPDYLSEDAESNRIAGVIILFKEKNVNKWIPHDRISSGMFRTFLHISEMFLLREGTVVLIDEFENSLGVNCINVLTEDLIFENSRLQFIATSHHPYIINKIPYEYWQIVTRKGGRIKTFDAKTFDLGASSHERFMNLINLPQYKMGVESLS